MSDHATPDDHSAEFATEADGEPGYGGRPGLATALCSLLIVASCVGSMSSPQAQPSYSGSAGLLGYIVGGGIVGAILWGVCYAITIRRASPRWQAVSLLILVALGVLSSLQRVGSATVARGDDQRAALTTMQSVLQNGVAGEVETAADAGPMTRLMAHSVNLITERARRIDGLAVAADTTTIVSFAGLTRSTAALDHCDRFETLRAAAADNQASFPTILADMRTFGQAMVGRNALSAAQVEGYVSGFSDSRPRYERQWALVAQQARDAGALCTILAKRRWSKDATGQVIFADHADLAQASPLLDRLRTAQADLAALTAQSRANAARGIEQLRTRP